MSLALDRGYEPSRSSEVADGYSARPAAARWRSGSLLSWNGSLVPRLWSAITSDSGKSVSDLRICRAAYRNRTDDLRITRGMLPRCTAATCTNSTTDSAWSAGSTGNSRLLGPRAGPRLAGGHRLAHEDSLPRSRQPHEQGRPPGTGPDRHPTTILIRPEAACQGPSNLVGDRPEGDVGGPDGLPLDTQGGTGRRDHVVAAFVNADVVHVAIGI